MATAYGIALTPTSAFRLTVEAQLAPGHGLLRIEGQFTQEVHNVVIAATEAIHSLAAAYPEVQPAEYKSHDLSVGLYSVEPVGGESYGLPLAMAMLGCIVGRTLSRDVCFTGVIEPAGHILPVDDIDRKRWHAAKLGFKKLVLPSSQLDLESTIIDQIPVDHILASMTGGFWK